MSDVAINRRSTLDRRNNNWQTVVCTLLRPRRRAIRRDFDNRVFIDWHHPWLFFLAVGTMLLSCADAFLTLLLIDRGMFEANPLMAAVLDQGVLAFTTSKMVLTGAGLLILVYLSRLQFFNRVRTGLILTVFFSGYCCLVCYELVSLLATL